MAAPLPVCYLNGEYLPLEQARISPLDRGFLFADGVYEVLPVFAGRAFRFREHFDRLARSLAAIRVASPHSHTEWLAILEQLVARNARSDLYLYVQVTRGMELGRNHTFPAGAVPTVFAMGAPLPQLSADTLTKGVAAITVNDFRWNRCDIKTTALLPNVLMRQAAADAGAFEAIIVRDGEVLEACASSVLAVIDGTLVTPPDSTRLLAGTTRDVVLELAEGLVPIAIRALRLDELKRASEVMLTAAARDTVAVTQLDGQPIGTGQPGPVWREISTRFAHLRTSLAGTPAL